MLLNLPTVSSPTTFLAALSPRRYRSFLAFAALALLSACGGNNGPDDAGTGARTVPQNVTLTTGTRMNELSWRGVSGARGYTVYWATEPGVSPASGTAIDTRQPYFEHRGLANDTTYYYVITSDTTFGQSTPSAVVEGTPRAARPARPGDLALQAGNGRITLRWDAVPGATHYTLYWKDSAGVSTDMGTNDARIERVVSPFVHPGLENGRDYFYRLVAENAHGASEVSEEHSAMPLPPSPSAPVITRAEVAAGQVTLHWRHAGAASQYALFWRDREPLDDDPGDDTASLTQVTSPYTHAPLQDGQTYYYRVQTRNDAGVSVLSNPVQVTPPGEASVAESGAVPAVPTDITVSLENGQLSLDWPPVAGALAYNLYWTTAETGDVTPEDARLTQIQPPYTHIPLNNGSLYRYRLSALNDHGESALSTEVNGVPQVVIPGVPAGVQALAGDASILVRWNPVQGATGYTLTVDDGSTTDTLTDVRSPYRITALSNATAYTIQLRAQNTQGLSEPSAPVSATPREPVPNTPGDLLARPGNASVLLQWTAAVPQNAEDPAEAITGYRVYTATRPGVQPDNATLIDATPTRRDDGRWQLHHTSLQNGQRYYYVVSALNAGGEGGLSREVWARPRMPAPGVPSSLSAEAGDGQVQIDFTPPDTLSDDEPATYNLYWTRALDDEGRSPTEVISNVQPGYRFSEGAGTNGTTYFFQVSAVSDGNEGPLSDEVSATPRVPAPGQAPQAARALTDSGRVTLDWAPVAQAGGYVIYWATDPDIDPRTSNRLSGEMIQPGFVHTGLENGQSYFYRVAAVNAGGEGSLSALLAAQPQVPPPATPTDFTLQPGDGQVTIDFVPSPAASYYRLFWHWDTEAPLAQWSSRTVQPGDSLTGLSNGQTLVYRLQALNAGGASPLSEPVSATPQPNPPATPSGLAVATGDGELDIRWHTRPGLRYTLYWSDDAEIAPRDSGNALSDARPTYRHTGLSNDTVYYYQVSASNGGGESAPSEPVQATPAGAMPGVPRALSAEGGQQQVTLRWLPPANATDTTQYTLYWSTLPDQGINGTALSAVSSPYVHTGLNNNQRYYYVITATTDSIEGPASAQAEALSSGGALPAQPQGVQGSTGDGQNTLQWQAVTGASEYTVQWSTQADMGTPQGTTVSAPPFVHDEPPASTLYYRVIARNGNGDSPPSAIVRIAQDSPNQIPQITQGAVISVSMDEDSSPTAFALSLNATDNDGDALSWTLATPAGRGSAQVTGNNTSATVAYTPQADVNGSDTFTVKVDDGQGGTDSIQIDVSITPQNDAPTISNTNLSLSLVENTPAVTAITVTDIDNSAFTYTLSGADSGLFSMSGNTLLFTNAPDFDAPLDSGGDNVYNVSMVANDGTNNSAAKAFVITVTDANDTVPVITNSNLAPSVGENTTSVTAITVTDSDSSTFTYTLSGADSALFSMSGNNLRFTAAPDFEAPQDSGADNTYNVSVVANDGSNDSAAKAFVITVTGVNDEAPAITNTDIIPNIDENTTSVTAITVTDSDSSTFTYALSGADSALFSMTGNTLVFTTTPDFEAPQDNGADNVYNVSVVANDGTNNSAAKAFVITVTDANDTVPVITNSNLAPSIAENTTTVTAITVTDSDSTTFTYTLSGADSALFSMSGNTLRFTNAPDFEAPQDSGADNVYNVSVTANDGSNDSAAKAFAITVTDANDTVPVITNSNLAPSIAENTTSITTITVTDSDSSAFTYALSGADSALFSLTGNTLRFTNAPDFEAPQDNGADNVYNVSVVANDGTNDSAAKAFVITVTDANDTVPVITNSNLTPSVGENTTRVTAITVTDSDSSAFTYVLSGADSALFSMAGNTLNFAVAPDFEAPQDNGADNVYNVSVVANDGTNNSAAKAFVITVTGVNDEAPVITNTDIIPDIDENTTTVTTITVTDNDSTTFTYTLSGADSVLFSLSGNTLRFIAAPDFEAPQDSGADNTYNVSVTASDGSNDSVAAAFTITVKNTNDVIPQITNAGTLSVPEQTTAITAITVADADSNAFTYRISGGEDSAFFSLSGNNLAFANPPDFLNPLDANSDNVYRVDVIVNDGVNDSVPMAFAVTVTGISGPRWRGAELIETDDVEGAHFPQIAMDANGNALAVWSQTDETRKDDIWANRYVAGNGWNMAKVTKINNVVSGQSYAPQIALDTNGNALAVWIQSPTGGSNVWVNRYIVGSGWDTPESIGAGNLRNIRSPQIAMDSDGNGFVVWSQDDGVWATRYVADSGWSSTKLIGADGVGFSSNPQIAIDTKGNALAVWEQHGGTRTNIWANRYVIGNGWSIAELIETDDAGSARFPQIVLDVNGNALAVWSQDDSARRGNVWANRYVIDSGWDTAKRIDADNAGNAYWRPQVDVDANGNALAVWEQWDGTRRSIWASRYVADSGWSGAKLIETNNVGNANSPQIVLDTNGNALAVWSQHDGTRSNIWANRYIIGNGWSNAKLIETDNAGDARSPQIAVDANGNALAVWHQYNGTTRYNIWGNRFE